MNPTYDSETNRVNLALTIDPGPTVAVKVEGARIWRRTLEKLIPVYQENSVDQDLIDEGQRNLVSYFQAKSFFDVEVHADVTKEADHVNIVYHVEKGSKHKVTGISFSGNKYFTTEQLQSHIVIRQARLILNRGKYSQDLLKTERGLAYNDVPQRGLREGDGYSGRHRSRAGYRHCLSDRRRPSGESSQPFSRRSFRRTDAVEGQERRTST